MSEIGIGAGLAALGFWLFIAVAAVAGIWDGVRKREAQHATLRQVLESGQQIDQELVGKLLGNDRRLHRDLKVSGLITLSAAPGLALMGWFISLIAEQALMPLLGVATLAGCVGTGLLVAARVAERSEQPAAEHPARSSMA